MNKCLAIFTDREFPIELTLIAVLLVKLVIYIETSSWKQITVSDTTVHQQKQYNLFNVTVDFCYQQYERSYDVVLDISV